MNRYNQPLRLDLSGRPRRSGAVAAALSAVFPGLGQAYLRHRRAALTFAIPVVLVIGVLLVLVLLDGLNRVGAKLLSPTIALGAALLVLLVGVWWILGVINAWRSGRRSTTSAALVPAILVLAIAAATLYGADWMYRLSVADRSFGVNCDPTLDCPGPSPTPGSSGIAVVPTPTGSGGPTIPPEDTPEPTEPPATIIPGPSPSFDITKIDAQDDGWLNVLLLGLDTRCAGGMVTGANTDTMIVVSANAATGELYEFSFPRDLTGFPLYVGGTMPGYWKLNTLAGYTKQHPETFADPGQPALAYEIGYLLGIPIDYYASINICGFPQLIDEVGGVDVCNTQADRRSRLPLGRRRTWASSSTPGEYHLDGDNALAFARSRHGSSDFARAKRQQQLLSALRSQILSPQNLARLAGYRRHGRRLGAHELPVRQHRSAAGAGRQGPGRPGRPIRVPAAVLGDPPTDRPDQRTIDPGAQARMRSPRFRIQVSATRACTRAAARYPRRVPWSCRVRLQVRFLSLPARRLPADAHLRRGAAPELRRGAALDRRAARPARHARDNAQRDRRWLHHPGPGAVAGEERPWNDPAARCARRRSYCATTTSRASWKRPLRAAGRAAAPPGAGNVPAFYEPALRALGVYLDQQQPRDVFFFEQEQQFVMRLLMQTRAGLRHMIVEFTRDEIGAMIAAGQRDTGQLTSQFDSAVTPHLLRWPQTQ